MDYVPISVFSLPKFSDDSKEIEFESAEALDLSTNSPSSSKYNSIDNWDIDYLPTESAISLISSAYSTQGRQKRQRKQLNPVRKPSSLEFCREEPASAVHSIRTHTASSDTNFISVNRNDVAAGTNDIPVSSTAVPVTSPIIPVNCTVIPISSRAIPVSSTAIPMSTASISAHPAAIPAGVHMPKSAANTMSGSSCTSTTGVNSIFDGTNISSPVSTR